MREDQIEALEKVQQEYFPNGMLVAGTVGEAIHTYVFVTPEGNKEYEYLLEALSTLLIESTDDLASQDGAGTGV